MSRSATARKRRNQLGPLAAALAAPIPDIELLLAAMANPDSGIRFVLGILRKAGQRLSEVQSVLFDKLKWKLQDAKAWLRDHGFDPAKLDEGATFWRFRQKGPGRYKEYATIVPGASNPSVRIAEARQAGQALGQKYTDIRIRPDRQLFLSELRRFLQTHGIRVSQSTIGLYEPVFAAGFRETYRLGNPGALGTGERRIAVLAARRGRRGNPESAVLHEEADRIRDIVSVGTDFEVRRLIAAYDVGDITGPETEAALRYLEIHGGPGRIAHAEAALEATGADTEAIKRRVMGRLSSAPKRSMRGIRHNPESDAAALYEDFHGTPPEHTKRIVTEREERDWLAELGTLTELKVATLSGLDATIRFNGNAPVLGASEDGRQLFIEGGDQAINLGTLKMNGDKWKKDSMVIGVLYELTYQTRKGFDKFVLSDYYHGLGEETGVQPMLLYDPHNKLLSVSGGQYQIKPEGIVN